MCIKSELKELKTFANVSPGRKSDSADELNRDI